jgi:hypothetical protein
VLGFCWSSRLLQCHLSCSSMSSSSADTCMVLTLFNNTVHEVRPDTLLLLLCCCLHCGSTCDVLAAAGGTVCLVLGPLNTMDMHRYVAADSTLPAFALLLSGLLSMYRHDMYTPATPRDLLACRPPALRCAAVCCGVELYDCR